ncbi:hypothetical protein DW725_02705 [Clostridiaceae bacterium AM27-36LB]|nr:hypothetical protein DW644_00540 [Clostridiales bacterium AM23-16LB]RHT85585.1 hypothetical protein DW725_02705 [Clostridiaceae bacterium AM27-36LB]
MKRGKKLLVWLLVTVMFLGNTLPAQAAWTGVNWPGLANMTGAKNYELFKSISNGSETYQSPLRTLYGYDAWIKMPEDQAKNFVIESYSISADKHPTILEGIESGKAYDLTAPVCFWSTETDTGRTHPFYLMAIPDTDTYTWTEKDKEEWFALIPEILDYRARIMDKVSEIEAQRDTKTLLVGSLNVAQSTMLSQLKDYFIKTVTGCREKYPDDGDYNSDVIPYTEKTLREDMQKLWDEGGTARLLPPRYTKAWMEALCEGYLQLAEDTRISAPEIEAVTLGDYYGVVDGDAHVTITVPEEVDTGSLGDPVIRCGGWVQANKQAGSVERGKLSYYLVPYEPTTGVTYDGIDQDGIIAENGQGMGVDLGKTWTIQIKRGEPCLEVTDFSIEVGGTVYHAKIQDNHIRLLLPEGTDLTALTPTITHTAQSTSMDGRTIDFTKETSLTLTLNSGSQDYTKTYTVEVTEGKSAESSLLTYQVAGVTGTPKNDGTLELTLPYGTDLSTAEVSWTLSDGAVMQSQPEHLSWNQPLTYVVQAENGENTTSYTVTLKEKEAAKGRKILKYAYGSSVARINDSEGTISLTVPAGTDLTRIKPTIEVSEFASVRPASGEQVDLSKTVRYTVTSQSGVSTTYKVTAQTDGPAENTYIPKLRQLLNAIVNRYEKSSTKEDWEWIDYAMAKKPDPSSADFPKDFDLYKQMKSLDLSSYAMSAMAKKIMLLTAMGYNASDLDQYRVNDEPFVLSSGKEVSDLVAELYNYDGSWTINHVTFALIALDIGNYTVPEDAYWTREKILETLLNHVYGSDGFNIDVVGNIMYAIAPYQDDPVYGTRVKAKLDEGLAIILGEKKANSCEAMTDDYMFKLRGNINSESASWVNMGLCSMGIDWHTDPRFTDGEKSALSQWLQFATNDGFKHVLSETRNNALATYEACYNLQWYLGFLDNGGAGHPYYLWYQVHNFATPLSTDANIESFEIQGQKGEIHTEEGTVLVKLPSGTPLENLTPEIQLSKKAKLKAPGLPVTFVEGVSQPFTVIAEDGTTTRTWSVKLVYDDDVVAAGTELKTESLSITDQNQRAITILDKTITETEEGTNILLTVPEGTDLTRIMLTAGLDFKAEASVSVDGKEALDLSDWKEIVVTAENGTKKVYRIRAQYEKYAAITGFYLTIGDKTYAGSISGTTISISGVPSDADVTSLIPEIMVNENTTVISPLSGQAQNFSNPVEYIVSGRDVKSKTYQVIVVKNGASAGDKDTDPDPTPTPTPTPGGDTDSDNNQNSSNSDNKYKSERLWKEMEKDENNTITDHQVVKD